MIFAVRELMRRTSLTCRCATRPYYTRYAMPWALRPQPSISVLGSDDDLNRIAVALAHDAKGLDDRLHRLQGELVSHQLSPAQASLAGQRDGAFDVIAPFTTCGGDGDIAAHHRTQV